MSESRVTLATIDAAAIDALEALSPTTGVCEAGSLRYSASRRPEHDLGLINDN